MLDVQPSVFLIARPSVDWASVANYLETVGGDSWAKAIATSDGSDSEKLVEFMGRLCYRSWAPGLNPNVTKIRTDSVAYLENILKSAHGSVLEHATYSFVFHNVSRVFTHELVRHRAGTAISQESMRFVRLTDIPFDHPEYVRADPRLLKAADELLAAMERFQELSAYSTGILDDGATFHDKKVATSAARRYAPEGVATSIGWSANIRALRHIIAARTAASAETEIRRVFDLVAKTMQREVPGLFQDFTRQEDGSWSPMYAKV